MIEAWFRPMERRPIMTATLQPPPSRPRDASPPSRRATASQVALEEMVAALRTIPHGGIDDGVRRFPLPPPVRATISPIVLTLRWTAVVAGAAFGITDPNEVPPGLVVTLGVCLALTIWRTSLPLTLASRRRADRTVALTDALVVALAVGFSGTAGASFLSVVVVTVAVASFGWGHRTGAAAALTAAAGLLAGLVASADGVADVDLVPMLAFAGVLVVAATGPSLARGTLLDAERRRLAAAGRMDALTQTNDLLTMLSSVARTLPSPLSLRDALDATHEELSRTFSPSVVCLLERDESNDEWVPKLAEGCILRPTCATDDLPDPLRRCLDTDGPLLVRTIGDDRPGISVGSRSGMYVRLQIRDRVVGLLGVEHRTPEQYGAQHARIFADMSGATALTLDNARRFGRLRSLGAEEERSRITRDLHDRLGQWLTYISFELERIIASAGSAAPELGHLYTDVQSALDELRETLRQLRSGVAEGRPLARVGADIVEQTGDVGGVESHHAEHRAGAADDVARPGHTECAPGTVDRGDVDDDLEVVDGVLARGGVDVAVPLKEIDGRRSEPRGHDRLPSRDGRADLDAVAVGVAERGDGDVERVGTARRRGLQIRRAQGRSNCGGRSGGGGSGGGRSGGGCSRGGCGRGRGGGRCWQGRRRGGGRRRGNARGGHTDESRNGDGTELHGPVVGTRSDQLKVLDRTTGRTIRGPPRRLLSGCGSGRGTRFIDSPRCLLQDFPNAACDDCDAPHPCAAWSPRRR